MIMQIVVPTEHSEKISDTLMSILEKNAADFDPPYPSEPPYRDCMTYPFVGSMEQIEYVVRDAQEMDIPFDLRVEEGFSWAQNLNQAYRPEIGILAPLKDTYPLNSERINLTLLNRPDHQKPTVQVNDYPQIWEFSFDLDTNALKKEFGETKFTYAYRLLQKSLEKEGFDDKSEKQGSCYFTSKLLTADEAEFAITRVGNEAAWLEKCLRRGSLSAQRKDAIDVISIIKKSDKMQSKENQVTKPKKRESQLGR